MTKFLHIADIHLGIRRYRSEERARDFYLAWKDCIEKYAIGERVSFVLIAGDLFDARKVEPQAMNQAMYGLTKLREAGIPALVIEGNHDCHEAESRFSWLRSLSQWGYIKLLEPLHSEGGIELAPWDEARRKGSFVDIEGVRVFGSVWYGSTISQALPRMVDSLRSHRDEKLFNILMLHTDVEGQLNRPIPALPVARINELREQIDYLALGHTHKRFEIDGWVFNPGSLEACSVDEYENERGAYLVEIEDGRPRAQLMRDYHQRRVIRRAFDAGGLLTPDEFHESLFAQLRREIEPHNPDETDRPEPVIELVIRGFLGFRNSLLELDRIRDRIKKEFRPLLAIVRNQTLPVEYAVAAGLSEHVSRGERERRVIEDLVSRDSRYRETTESMSSLVLETKKLALGEEQPAKIAELIRQRISP